MDDFDKDELEEEDRERDEDDALRKGMTLGEEDDLLGDDEVLPAEEVDSLNETLDPLADNNEEATDSIESLAEEEDIEDSFDDIDEW